MSEQLHSYLDASADAAPVLPTLLPTLRLDDIVHQRNRLGIMTLLHLRPVLDFSALRDCLHLTDGNLNRHLKVLHDAGFVRAERRGTGRQKTWVSITDAGRAALETELSALRALILTSEG